MTLGERLKAYRLEHSLSQEQLAEKMCVSRQAITKWENDAGLPDIANLITISRELGVSLDELVLGEDQLREKAVMERESKAALHMVSAVCFFTAAICWTIAGCVTLSQGVSIAPALQFFTACLSLVAAFFQFRLYRKFKEQGK